jgi:hypothetical protein
MVAKTVKPAIMIAWQNTQPSRRRKPPVPTLSGPLSAAAASPVKAKTRRLHVATLPDDGTSFAAGFRDAVRSHLAGMKAAKGGAL